MVAATSGNTGASVAMISAMKGYHYIGMLLGGLQPSNGQAVEPRMLLCVP